MREEDTEKKELLNGSKKRSQEVKNGDQPSLRRRSILKSSGVGAFGLFGLRNILNFKSVDRTTRIVAARKGVKAEPIHTKKVPKKWLEHQKEMRKITEQLRKKFENTSFVDSISYVATDRMEGGVYYSEPEIAVHPNATDDQLDQLPDSLGQTRVNQSNALVGSDIKVRRMEGEPTLMNVDCYRGVAPHPFRGGIEIRDGNRDVIGTGGCKAIDNNGGEYLYTANHVVANSCNIGTGGITDADGDYLGHGADGHKTHDWVMVNDNSTSYSDYIWYEEGSARVHGYATQPGLESIQGQRGTLKFQGVISGFQDAYVKGGGASFSGPNGCIKWFGSATKLGVPDYFRQGDSGGPFWWPTSDGNHVVTVLSAGEARHSYSGCGISGQAGRPAYGYPFWRIANNTKYTIQ